MSVIDGIKVDVSIVLGSAHVPIRQILKMSRGAIIPLDCGYDDPTLVYVNNELVAEGQIVDAQGYELFAKAGVQRLFKVLMRFDEARGVVRSADQEWSVEWRAGVPELTLVASGFRGQKWEMSFETVYAFREDGSWGEIYDYKFNTGEIKGPLQKAVAEGGWGWKGVAFGKL